MDQENSLLNKSKFSPHISSTVNYHLAHGKKLLQLVTLQIFIPLVIKIIPTQHKNVKKHTTMLKIILIMITMPMIYLPQHVLEITKHMD
jgi:hypothetical protein